MRFTIAALVAGALSPIPPVAAERPFINEPDTGLNILAEAGSLPSLDAMIGAPDFEAAARNKLDVKDYSYYRTGVAGEYSYRRNLEIYKEITFRPRLLRDVSNVDYSTTILGYKFDAPFFIAPTARAGLAHPRGELNLVEAAGEGNILYVPSISASQKLEDIAALRRPNQTMFHQLYVSNNKTKLASDLSRIEASGYKAIFVTIDNPIHGVRHREARYGWSNTTDHDAGFTWEGLKELQSMTSLPVIPKGIQSVEDAKLAVKAGCRAIYVSNHGGRQLDTSPHPIEVLLEIRQFAPWVFEKVEVYADGGVRYGTDVIKLLALGAKAVGIGRPFAYAGVYGVEGVKKLVEILKREVWIDMANVGLTDVGDAGMRYINARKLQMLL